jgi:hypothetical protein
MTKSHRIRDSVVMISSTIDKIFLVGVTAHGPAASPDA